MSEEFLNHPETVYPVTIDPSVTADAAASNVEDGFVKESAKTGKYGTYDYLQFGYLGGRIYSYVRFITLPTIEKGAYFTSATFKVTFRTGQDTPAQMKATAKEISGDFNEKTLCWNNRPAHKTVQSSVLPQVTNGYLDYYNFTVTKAVRNWYSDVNYGLMFDYETETYNDYNSVVSSEGDAARSPKLTINYTKPAAQTSGIVNNAYYYIKNVSTGKYLDIQGTTAVVGQSAYDGKAHQLWQVHYYGNGGYTLTSPQNTELCMNSGVAWNGGGIYVDTNPTTHTNTGTDINDALMMIVPTASGNFRITSRSTGSFWALTAGRDGASSVNNYMYTGATDQQWVFETIANKSTSFNAFSSFSIGDDNMSGYNHFNNYLEGRTLNSKRYYPLVKFNYTLGKISKTSLIESLTCSDVAFIDSHATATGIWMKDNTGTQYDTIRLASDIGTNFKTGSTTITNTPFNKKTKWIIIQACSQLNYTDGGTADDNSALQWAKALLGDGVRMHGVLGYYGSGPEGDIAGSKLEIFMASQINLSSRPNMITGWKLANESLSGSSSWAGICHRANLDDKLYWGWTANTAKGSVYIIDRYSYENGTQKPLPVSTTQISPNSDSTMNLLLENENIANQKFTLESKAFTSTQLQKIRNTLNSANLNISLDGKLTYLDSLASPTEATSALEWTEEQAIRQAKKYLDTLGLLPQNNYLVKTSTTVREELDVFNETVSSAETVGWTIRFYQTQNGVPVVSSEDNGILMTISEKGLHSLQYNWKNIVPVSQTKGLNSDCEKLLSKNEAIKKYCNKVSVENVDVHKNVCYRQVYVYQNDTLTPAWVFGTEDAFFEPTYINALTGETLHIN